MADVIAKRKQDILKVLRRNDCALSSKVLTEELRHLGHDLSERTVRLYLLELDQDGLTENLGRRGRLITEQGIVELDAAHTLERVGFLSSKIDNLTYSMDFDLALRKGSVVVNTSLMTRDQLRGRLDYVMRVFEKHYAMGQLVALLEPGDRCGEVTVPDGMIGFCSVCSITINGVLLKHGIPTYSRFGGLMEIRDSRAERFVEIITYDGTTIDPLEIFIRGAMTNYTGAITTGNGRIGASFREIPAESRDLVVQLAQKLDQVGLGGFLQIGLPGQSLFDIPVSEGRVGAVVIGGLNPVAVLEESGIRVESRALSGLLNYHHLFPYYELPQRVGQP